MSDSGGHYDPGMDHFSYRDGRLFCEDVDLVELAAEVGTPCYVYSRATLELHYDRLTEAFGELRPLICYSVKSNSNLSVVKVLADRGSGMDVVSGGELHRARLAGVPMDRVVYAGVGKTDEEIQDALGVSERAVSMCGGEGIGLFNIESEMEFETIGQIAQGLGVVGHAALRINPDVDPKTHRHTTTGKMETKFGVDLDRAKEFFRRYGGHPNLKLTGLHIHIGSPVYDTKPYQEAVAKTLGLIDDLAREGYRIDTLDIGGGLAADYETGASKPAKEYASVLVPMLKERVENGLKIIMEPGRTISANAGVLLGRVQYVKQGGNKKFVVCDIGMHTLIRPVLYDAFHFVWPANVAPMHVPERREESPDLPGLDVCDVVGPLCETGDYIALGRKLPPVARGDVVAVFGAGAYGMSLASRYNSHGLAAEVLVEGGRARVVRRRETLEDLVEHEMEGIGMQRVGADSEGVV